jgi:hypothetical protein
MRHGNLKKGLQCGDIRQKVGKSVVSQNSKNKKSKKRPLTGRNQSKQ